MLVDRPPAGDRWVRDKARQLPDRRSHRSRAGADAYPKGLDWTERFGPIARALAQLSVRAAYLDGEVIVLRPDGVSSFADLQGRCRKVNPGGWPITSTYCSSTVTT